MGKIYLSGFNKTAAAANGLVERLQTLGIDLGKSYMLYYTNNFHCFIDYMGNDVVVDF